MGLLSCRNTILTSGMSSTCRRNPPSNPLSMEHRVRKYSQIFEGKRAALKAALCDSLLVLDLRQSATPDR